MEAGREVYLDWSIHSVRGSLTLWLFRIARVHTKVSVTLRNTPQGPVSRPGMAQEHCDRHQSLNVISRDRINRSARLKNKVKRVTWPFSRSPPSTRSTIVRPSYLMSNIETFRAMTGITQTGPLEITHAHAEEIVRIISAKLGASTSSTAVQILSV